jgi:hypothetical protein
MSQLSADDYVRNIQNERITIHTPIEVGDPNLWIPDELLEAHLNTHLVGLNVAQYANRTRSKVIKQAICSALGYPIETSFPRKYKPRFTGQNFDTYSQKAPNLQVWNDTVSPHRRYVITGINDQGVIYNVKVINGSELATLDKTGTITKKHQASFVPSPTASLELISRSDTVFLNPYLTSSTYTPSPLIKPTAFPTQGEILPISEVFKRLSTLIGQSFPDPGPTQERLRGAELHKLVCLALGYSNYADDGKFPDVKHQLLEVKLQTSPTIDLGVICPNQTDNSGFSINNTPMRYCDTRYAVVYGVTDGVLVTLTHLVLSTGVDFFSRFAQFQGNVVNGKIQIPLPRDFFN